MSLRRLPVCRVCSWTLGFNVPRWLSLQCRRPGFDPWVGKIPWRRKRPATPVFLGFPGGSAGKDSACNAGDLGLIPWLGRSPGGGHGNPVQDSGLKNSLTIVHGIRWEALERGDICLHMADLHCCRRKLT